MLYTKEEIENPKTALETWQERSFTAFGDIMTSRDHAYPCVPGIQGYTNGMLRFGFLEDPRSSSASEQLGELLKSYGEVSRQTGSYTSLVVFCDTRALLKDQLEIKDYENVFWSLLNQTHALDEKEWPEDISQDPEDPSWEFCFHGEPYFAFCATPAHTKRNSRCFPSLLLAFQPRWVFENINDSTTYGRRLKNVIRKRLLDYDDLPAHPALKWYGQEDNHEWEQYFLRDDDTSLPQCPFLAKTRSLRP
ncbi:YqcI/YcgG family protein [Halobacillus sp. Cin3]|uniref:YqcI/YcgG family protein n=1 Tax=Halobacillus sp. Cin3 TaxID=2928441 RepID=UPI00248F0799|nr:YqcI/YcgG family protein [Halobacillus sp. Cin3]